MKSEDTIL